MLGRFFSVLALGLLMVAVGCDSGADDVTVDRDGVVAGSIVVTTPDNLVGGKLPSGQTVDFPVRVANTTGEVIGGMTNGLRVYSPDGATWGATSADTTGLLGRGYFDLVLGFSTRSLDGSGADTVGFQGAAMQLPGLPIGFDEHAYTITIGPIPTGQSNRTVCIDSCWYPPSGKWLWATGSDPNYFPIWEGPYCWKIGQ